MPAVSAPGKSFNPWPVAIIGFLALVFAGCAAFIVFCALHPSELVRPDYYDQEVRYQAQIDSLRRGQEPGAKPTVAYDATRQSIRISFTSSVDLAQLTGRIQLYRPAAASQDRRLALRLDPGGRQEIDVRDLEPGLWKLRLSWELGGETRLLEEKVIITAGGT